MYKKRKQYNPSLLEMIFEIFITLTLLLGKLIFKLIIKIFSKKKVINKNDYKIVKEINPIPTNSANIAQEIPKDEISNNKRYALKQSILSPAEKNFLSVLEKIVDGKYIIENQVQLSRIVTPLDSNISYTNYSDFNKIKAKSIDFVLFNKDYSPYLCIELDDISHLKWERQKRDMFVNKVMAEVGLRIIHIRTSFSYDLENLKRQIFSNSMRSTRVIS